ncbi:glutamyl-tRNA reductase [Candidatus Marinamargulisbacteria bacterium SCGC AG-439-L15]|nr:glutamyl-tRNA reductase [Candidatus Marinamargulisbacteria bacterium SCGC AG-439-L15]
MKIAVFGTNYRYAALNLLEKLYFDEARVKSFLEGLPKDSFIKDLIVLATCNRSEVYFLYDDYEAAKRDLLDYMVSFLGVSRSILVETLYFKQEVSAIRHLYEVSAGVSSMVLGETEILSQVKESYSRCQRYRSVSAEMNKLFQSAIFVGKKVREETSISKGAYSISSIAIDAVCEHYGDFLTNRKILFVGAGTMTTRAVKKLKALGHQEIYVTNRSEARLTQVAGDYGLAFFPYDQLSEKWGDFDVIYFATSCNSFILKNSESTCFEKPVLLIDVGVPRNVDPKLSESSLVTIKNIDGLKDIADQTLEDRKKELPKIHAIIQDNIEQLRLWQHNREKFVATLAL